LITYVKDRLGHDRHYAINAGKITAELGYAPAGSFENSFKKTVEWYLTNLDWCQNIMGGKYRGWIEKNYEE
jgi:dTDP-glucose 4,6-dehydratase